MALPIHFSDTFAVGRIAGCIVQPQHPAKK